jgi:iron complex transport system permease protein
MSRIRRPRTLLVLPLLLLALFTAITVATAYGSVSIAESTVFRVLLRQLGLVRSAPTWSPETETILLTLRLPRAVAAALVGSALAAAGVLFQGLLRNPLADPYVVGSSGGAALGAVIGMLLGERLSVLGFGIVPVTAFLGALGAMLVVVRLAGVGGHLPVVTVLLAGFAVSTLLGYTVSLLLVLNDRLQIQMPRIYGWLLGGIAVTGWSQLAVVAPLIGGTLVATLGLARALNAFSLGEEGAARLGIAVERDKRLLLAAGSLLTAAAVSVSGLIGFVGLIVPHVTRLLCGPDHRLLLPASALAGASFLVLADLLARTVLPPAELPVGIVTAFLGGPFFLWLLRKSRREYQW